MRGERERERERERREREREKYLHAIELKQDLVATYTEDTLGTI